MPVLVSATASGKQLAQAAVSTSATSIYTAPANTANVTTPSATAYMKELIICNTTASAATITVYIGTSAVAATAILLNVTVSGNDTKILSGLNTMIPAGSSIFVSSNAASALTVTISGVEVQ